MIIIIFCNFCNGLAVVAWSPLLYILKWNVNLLYYCTHCNWTNRLSFFYFRFSVNISQRCSLFKVQTITLTATKCMNVWFILFAFEEGRIFWTVKGDFFSVKRLQVSRGSWMLPNVGGMLQKRLKPVSICTDLCCVCRVFVRVRPAHSSRCNLLKTCLRWGNET